MYNFVQPNVSREFSQPKFTNYSLKFKGVMDHIMHNNRLKVIELLELPPEADLSAE